MAASNDTAPSDRTGGGRPLTELVDLGALARFLADRFPVGDLDIVGQVFGGSSNVTVFLTYDGREWVLRRPPPGPLIPTSHDMLREFRFISALHGSAVPVPRPVVACDDESVIGAPFYIMERVLGVVLQDEIPVALDDPAERRRLSEAAVDTLVALHAIDWAPLDLPGRPDGYLSRQVRRWTSQLELTPTAPRLTGIDVVTHWINANLPESGGSTIVHGDFGLHNMIVSPEAPVGVEAVLDWEMATIGDPIADVVWFLQGWGALGNPANEVTTRPGALTSEQMIDRYESQAGTRIVDRKFYEVFCGWKGAIILEGLYSAFVAGNAANEAVSRFAEHIPAQVERLADLVSH